MNFTNRRRWDCISCAQIQLECRSAVMHISNAGWHSEPGINTIQVRVGFGRFAGKSKMIGLLPPTASI